MKKMFSILCVMVLCMSVGAHDHSGMTMEEIASLLDEIIAQKYTKDTSSTKAYPSEPTEPSSKSSHGWSTTETTSRDYGVTQPGGHTTESTSRDYEVSQPDESEKYDPADHSSEGHPIRIGSLRGIPGVNFPDYKDIPLTSFSCSDKVHVPGFYADMEAGCQVFHVCWPHRRESFLCPIGTIFNQPILACDYWYSSNCSLASHYYEINSSPVHTGGEFKDSTLSSMVDSFLEKGYSKHSSTYEESTKGTSKQYDPDLSDYLKFLPVKSKVVVYTDSTKGFSKIVAEASVGRGKLKETREELTTEYIPVQPKYTPALPPKETLVPKVVVPKITSKHSHEIDPINRIIDEIFDIAKEIVREAEGLRPILDSIEGDRMKKPIGEQKPLPLTKLKQRFITKPASIPAPEVKYGKSTVRAEESPKAHFPPTQKTIPVTFKPQYKPVVRKASSHKFSVSPLTKKALTENYLRMLKLRD